MRKFIFTTAVCLSAMSQMMAQNISGKIVDAKGEPLAFANVMLLNRQDSTFVKGVVSGEDGHFAIDSPCNNGIIKVSSVGYKTVWKDCAGENAGVIKMLVDSKMLGEVVVKSSLPKTLLKNGGMTTTVAGSVLERQELWSICSTAYLTYLHRMATSRCLDVASLSSISTDGR